MRDALSAAGCGGSVGERSHADPTVSTPSAITRGRTAVTTLRPPVGPRTPGSRPGVAIQRRWRVPRLRAVRLGRAGSRDRQQRFQLFDLHLRPQPVERRAGRLCQLFRGSDFALERSEEHTSELQSLAYLVCRLLLEKKKKLACELPLTCDRV